MKVQKVLFSCLGTTDPARGGRDGGLMHIMRHHRPAAVCIFLSAGILRMDQQDNRFSKMMAHIQENWDYSPDLIRVEDPTLEKAADLDLLDQPLHNALDQLVSRYPDAEILVNLSSGTPQMKMILAQMVLEPRYKIKGIQVTEPNDQAGTADRTNAKNYDVDEQLKLAEQNEVENPKNRLLYPKLIPLIRDRQWQQISALLTQRNYEAILSLEGSLPPKQMQLVRHLAARYQLDDKKAREACKDLDLGFPLYPANGEASEGYREAIEYFLMMRNFETTNRYTDFVLRLNPLTLQLQQALLQQLLKKQYDLTLTDLMAENPKFHRQQLMAALVAEKTPELFSAANESLVRFGRRPLQDSDLSIYICNLLLAAFPDLPQKMQDILWLFRKCEKLNSIHRNKAAHSLHNLTDDDIRRTIGLSCEELVRHMEDAIQHIYPECDPAIFTIYERCEEYIRQNH